MKLKIGEVEYEFNWRHENPVTVCTVSFLDSEGKPSVAVGNAVKGKKDQFCRDVGRKVSLGRAMANIGMPKEARKMVWDLYFARLPVDKRPSWVA